MQSIGRVVRVVTADGYEPESLVVSCPACGTTHPAKPFWRTVTRFDDGRQPDLVIGTAS